MSNVGRSIFKAIHEGKWLNIEYKNKNEQITKYWIGINNLNIRSKTLSVDAMHIVNYSIKSFNIFIERIISAYVIDGTYQPINYKLIENIKRYPEKYYFIFNNTANLKILNYLTECSKLDTVPYQSNFHLINRLDNQIMQTDYYRLDDEQFKAIIRNFQHKSSNKQFNNYSNICQLCMNVLSVNTSKGLYMLAYRELNLDVKEKVLKPKSEINICREFSINGIKQSVHQFLDAEDYFLLENFEDNLEVIKDKIAYSQNYKAFVNDMPYIMSIESTVNVPLDYEYRAILDMYEKNDITTPIKAFFGDIVSPYRNRKDYPITLLSKKVNLDQLLAIHYAMKYPISYIQGPPGTGKTQTIINTIITAFFNEKTVLFSSYNNKPIDSVFEALSSINFRGKTIPFPILRIGNKQKIMESINSIKQLINATQNITIYNSTLDKNKEAKAEQTKQLTELLKNHEKIIDLNERKEAIEDLKKINNNMNFRMNLDAFQLNKVNQELAQIGEATDEQALALLNDNEESFLSYLYYTSAKYIKKLNEPKYNEFRDIIYLADEDECVKKFSSYISKNDNFEKLLKVFPIMTSTCISAHKIGVPKPYFDMTIIDEASQCNLAMSLLPIIRGNKLMLVGDPQQLNPVIVLDSIANNTLKNKYNISEEYDYIKNSIYKTYLACDSVSNEILLSYHYRCNKNIIDFNNKKYYNNKLKIKSQSNNKNPLVFIDIPQNTTSYKNTSPAETDKIIQYAKNNGDRSIGIITPFANQKNYINKALSDANIKNVTCGTVHTFQGDEKDVILFSLAITDKTHINTYDWLKNNKELINVAVSRAKEQIIVFSSQKELDRLHKNNERDDIYEFVNYVKSKGISKVTPLDVTSRALGIKPYSTETEEAFLENLNHSLTTILYTEGKYSIEREVAISQVFSDNTPYNDLFYTGRFDFVIYIRDYNKQKIPVLAIELDGKEHFENEIVMMRDKKKNEICKNHGFDLIRVENSYARRYNFIKNVLIDYFGKRRR
ncbi:MAG: AAA domain-containing protein [Ruminococcus sp.]|nr:AAA domain-containing protein [Ruminococcus sp.]